MTATSTPHGTISRRDVAVLQKESLPLPRERRPVRARAGEDVKVGALKTFQGRAARAGVY